ncbi:LamG domain-containing protein [Phycisphaeraceae bacterium D3-23]
MIIRNLTVLPAAAAALAFAGGASAANLVNYWSFEAGFGDSVGSGGGTAGSEVTTGTGHDGNTAAVFPAALSGGGPYNADGYVDTTGVTVSGAFAFSYWFNISDDGTTDPRGIFDMSGNGGDGPQSLYIGNSDSLAFRVDGDGGTGGAALYDNGGAGFEDGQWHFVVGNYDPVTGITLHVDGSGVDASAGGFGNATFDADQYLGAFNVGDPVTGPAVRGLNGSLDDVALYSGTLTAAEIDGLFAGTIQPTDIPEPGSLALLGLGGLALLRRRRA